MYSLPQKFYFESVDFLSTTLNLRKLLILSVLAENLTEDPVHVGQLAVHGKSPLNLFKWKKGRYFLIRFHRRTEARAALP